MVATVASVAVLGATASCGTNPDGDQPTAGTWPGGDAVSVADDAATLGKNMSGLSFGRSGVLWAVKNDPATLYRLVSSGDKWTPDRAEGWKSGKRLHYANGGGNPDSEGVTSTADGLFVSTEGGNDDSGNRQKILRFDGSSRAKALTATAEWDLTGDLPDSPDNKGIEGIGWIPDTYLRAHHFHDDHADSVYDPADYPDHGSGLYLVGLESNGTVYAYALDQNGSDYTRVASARSGLESLMGLEFDPGTGHLWAVCDDTCDGRSVTLDIGAKGRLDVTAEYDRPSGMPDYNNEGIAIASRGTCANGDRQVLWSDDDNDDDHALRSGTLPCSGVR